jgi:hypothetical protein
MRSMNAAVAYALWKYIRPTVAGDRFPLAQKQKRKKINKKKGVHISEELYTVTFGPSVTN